MEWDEKNQTPKDKTQPAIFKPRETKLEMKGHTLPPVPAETLYQQIIGSQAIEGFEPFHKSAEELMRSVEQKP